MPYHLPVLSPLTRGCGRVSWMGIYLVVVAVATCTFLVYTPLPGRYDYGEEEVAKSFRGYDHIGTPDLRPTISLETTDARYAFATFLASDSMHPDDQNSTHDNYFIATRLLGYQILHDPETRSEDVPFIVLTTDGVSEKKRERLRRDGALVLTTETVEKPDWLGSPAPNWMEVLDKLRLWELTQFDRICFLDGDTVLNRPLDGIFKDPATALQDTLDRPDQFKHNEGPLPASYAFAGQPEMNPTHRYPPSDVTNDYLNINYLNAGFFVLQPSLEMLRHYLNIIQAPNRFPPGLPEQNLLNYAHRREKDGGSMPWKAVGTQWNVHYPTLTDLKGGVASLHEKWWAPVDPGLSPYLNSWRWKMEGFYEALDSGRGHDDLANSTTSGGSPLLFVD